MSPFFGLGMNQVQPSQNQLRHGGVSDQANFRFDCPISPKFIQQGPYPGKSTAPTALQLSGDSVGGHGGTDVMDITHPRHPPEVCAWITGGVSDRR